MDKKKVIINKLLKVTPGKHQGLYDSNVGIIRKPLGQTFHGQCQTIGQPKIRINWWSKFKEFFKK